MKTKKFYLVVLAVIVAMTGVCNSVHAQSEVQHAKKFVNVVKKDGKPTEKTVYRAQGNELFSLKQFLYSYDGENRISQIDVNIWNEQQACWELRYSAVYSYENGMFTQQMLEYKVGKLEYQIIADANKIKQIMMQ